MSKVICSGWMWVGSVVRPRSGRFWVVLSIRWTVGAVLVGEAIFGGLKKIFFSPRCKFDLRL